MPTQALVTDIDISGYSPAYFAPEDGQRGDPLGGPPLFKPVHKQRTRHVATVGLDPDTYLQRSILWVCVDVPGIHPTAPDKIAQCDAQAVLIDAANEGMPTWEQLLQMAGDRSVVVDVEAAIAMAKAGGDALTLQRVTGSCDSAISVFGQRRENSVYPSAPRVDVVAEPPAPSGFAEGDRFHLYGPSEADGRAIDESDGVMLRALADDAGLKKFAERFKASVWGRAADDGAIALLSCATPGRGQVTVMDLRAVDRQAEPSNAETLGVQLLLSLLGISEVAFGRFVTAYATYDQYVQAVHDLAGQYEQFASMERIGQSTYGRDIWMLKIATDSSLPIVLNTVSIHPYEWASNYGLLRYVRYLLDGLARGGFVAKELLDGYQFWWVLTLCPDGFEVRGQQKNGINLVRNFPGVWERCTPDQLIPGARGGPAKTAHGETTLTARGPAPASQPETQTLLNLMDREGVRFSALADYHEAVTPTSFLHQVEFPDGSIPHVAYHQELLEGVDQAFNDRFWVQRDDNFIPLEHLNRFVPGRVSGTTESAEQRGFPGVVIEANGGDCTHYQTVRRIEYDAQIADQLLALQNGRLHRNRWNGEEDVTLQLSRRPATVECRLYDANDNLVDTSHERNVTQIKRTVPAAGCMRLRYE